jgi:hypothetical protein
VLLGMLRPQISRLPAVKVKGRDKLSLYSLGKLDLRPNLEILRAFHTDEGKEKHAAENQDCQNKHCVYDITMVQLRNQSVGRYLGRVERQDFGQGKDADQVCRNRERPGAHVARGDQRVPYSVTTVLAAYTGTHQYGEGRGSARSETEAMVEKMKNTASASTTIDSAGTDFQYCCLSRAQSRKFMAW